MGLKPRPGSLQARVAQGWPAPRERGEPEPLRRGTLKAGIRLSRQRRPRDRGTTWQGVVKKRLTEPSVVEAAETSVKRKQPRGREANTAFGPAGELTGRKRSRGAVHAGREPRGSCEGSPSRLTGSARVQGIFGFRPAFGPGTRVFGPGATEPKGVRED